MTDHITNDDEESNYILAHSTLQPFKAFIIACACMRFKAMAGLIRWQLVYGQFYDMLADRALFGINPNRYRGQTDYDPKDVHKVLIEFPEISFDEVLEYHNVRDEYLKIKGHFAEEAAGFGN